MEMSLPDDFIIRCRMNEKEVENPDEETKKLYDMVKSSIYDIKSNVRSVAETEIYSALTADRIRKLQTHVNGPGMTMEE